MSAIYLLIVGFLLCLAVFDLFVGVSNDAVNFLQSAVGARVAKFRTILIVASLGVILGAVMSSGMMDVARHGMMVPAQFTFAEVMTLFLAVMVTDIIILDVFNTLGMPTSTTVSLVFELLGGAFILATIKILGDDSLDYGMLLNSGKALSVIIAIFVSVAVAFVFGVIVMWLSRLVFTFNYTRYAKYFIGIFGGIAFTALAYFIFLKGIGKSPYMPAGVSDYIDHNTKLLLVLSFIISTVIMQVLHLMKVNIFKFVVLMGTFGLAMAFAGNDLVNFIGVPLAGLDSYMDYTANGHGMSPDSFMMSSLMESAQTPPLYLILAGVIMIIAMSTSKKAQNVIKTSVDLSRQDEGDEMFGASRAARAIVRFCQNTNGTLSAWVPTPLRAWVGKRFNNREVILADDKAAFDLVRASVNLVLASMLITIGTNYRLPLSTTYVTFMVAMGSSLADKAWSRESAVFRVTGVLSVIGGWFVTAGVAFLSCALVCLAMYYGGMVVQVAAIALVVLILVRSNKQFKKKLNEVDKSADTFQLMMRTRDPGLVWELLYKQVSRTQSYVTGFALEQFNTIMDGLAREDLRSLRRTGKALRAEQSALKNFRRREMLGLRRCPMDIAIERNTWFHLGANSNQQFIYSLRRMLEPIQEHVENNFNPLPQLYIDEFMPIRQTINDLMKQSAGQIETGRYQNYRDILNEADACKDQLSVIRKRHIDRIQHAGSNETLKISLLYLNILQESQEFLSTMRHQLRAAKKFMEN
ncbi:MAG: inorganic phosphate transporter [Prevotella sp.]|nr:inorganic phosphate transporter [Prevotella sp.]